MRTVFPLMTLIENSFAVTNRLTLLNSPDDATSNNALFRHSVSSTQLYIALYQTDLLVQLGWRCP